MVGVAVVCYGGRNACDLLWFGLREEAGTEGSDLPHGHFNDGGGKCAAITGSFTLSRMGIYPRDTYWGQYGCLHSHCLVNHPRNDPQPFNGTSVYLNQY